MTPRWDPFRAEYADVRRSAKHNRRKRPCIYCGTPTRATSQICCNHEDLPAFEGRDLMRQPERESDHF